MLQPAEGSAPGDRVFVEGYSETSAAPDLLNPKKKIWDKLQVIIMVYYAVLHRDITEPAKIRIADFMCKIRRMRICGAITITSYYDYCNSIELLKMKQPQTK